MATIVSFGRKTAGGEELPDDVWNEFALAVGNAVGEQCSDGYFAGEGVGNYEGEEETSFTIVASDPEDRLKLAASLGRLARRFGQESIALTVGATELVKP